MASVLILMPTDLFYEHIDMSMCDHYLFDLCKLWQVRWDSSRIYLVLYGHKVGSFLAVSIS